jgi:hypothetical protein
MESEVSTGPLLRISMQLVREQIYHSVAYLPQLVPYNGDRLMATQARGRITGNFHGSLGQ